MDRSKLARASDVDRTGEPCRITINLGVIVGLSSSVTCLSQLPTGSLHSPRIHTLINFVGFTVYKRYTALGKSDKDKYGTVARAMCGFVEEAIKL